MDRMDFVRFKVENEETFRLHAARSGSGVRFPVWHGTHSSGQVYVHSLPFFAFLNLSLLFCQDDAFAALLLELSAFSDTIEMA